MTPVTMANETRSIGKPTDWNKEQDGECSSLSVEDITAHSGHNIMVSAWQPSAEELAALNAGGYVYLGIYGKVHPVVCLTVELV